MRLLSVRTISILCATTLALSACDNPTTSQGLTFRVAKDVTPETLFKFVSQNSRKVRARTKTAGNQTAIVTYNGAARDLIICIAPGSDTNLASTMRLNTRTTIVTENKRLSIDTLYIATRKSAIYAGESVAFSTTMPGEFEEGLVCRTTRKLEKTLLGLE